MSAFEVVTMTVERVCVTSHPRPWGVENLRPWSDIVHDRVPIGELSFDRAGDDAPAPALLLKILFTHAPLSVQVHPDDAFAKSIGLQNGKTEAWYVLNAKAETKVALGLRHSMTPQQVRASADNGTIADLVAWHDVAPGDVIFVPAGTIHALGAGLVVAEIQQRSDTTFRLFDHGRSRELQIDRAIEAATLGPADQQVLPKQLTPERSLLCSNPHFVFERIELEPNSRWSVAADRETWAFIVSGSARAASFDVGKGDALFAEADCIAIRAGPSGVVALIAYTGGGGPVALLLLPSTEVDVESVKRPAVIQRAPNLPPANPTHEGASWTRMVTLP
jgi:mannose-6-phosphate isomerase